MEEFFSQTFMLIASNLSALENIIPKSQAKISIFLTFYINLNVYQLSIQFPLLIICLQRNTFIVAC
jgi:hypothetical protein